MDRCALHAIFLLLLVCAMTLPTLAFSYGNETALKTHLLRDYDKTVRSVSPTYVNVNIVLMTLNELVIEKQEMSVTGVFYVYWNDYRLVWDPANYGNIGSIMVDYDTVWQPVLNVKNSVDTMKAVGAEEKPSVRIYSPGFVKWIIPLNLRVLCEMKIFSFPFDTQECRVNLYSLYDVSEISLIFEDGEIYLEVYKENGEWDLVSAYESLSNITDGLEVFSEVDFVLKFKRKWRFQTLSMIIPAILNSFLMSAVFALPFSSGEKMGYALTVLLTYIVLLTLVTDSLPPISNDISALHIYLTGVTCVGTAATLLTVWTVTIYNQDPRKPRPPWVVYLCRRLIPSLFCWTRRHAGKSSETLDKNEKDGGNQQCGGKDQMSPVGKMYERASLPAERCNESVMLRTDPLRNYNNTALETSYQLPRYHCEQSKYEMIISSNMGSRDRSHLKTFDNTGPLYQNDQLRKLGDRLNDPACPPQVYFKSSKGEQRSADFSKHVNGKDQSQFASDASDGSCPGALGSCSETTSVVRDERYNNYQSASADSNSDGDDEHDITWSEVATLMDAVFLRLVSFVIIGGTLALITFYGILYNI